MYNSWNLSAEEYLNDYLPSYNALMVLETDPNDQGLNNYITIGQEQYDKKVGVSLQNIKKIDVETGKRILGVPVEYKTEEEDIIKFHK